MTNSKDSIVDKILKGEYDIDNPETAATVSDDCTYDPENEDNSPEGDEETPYEDEDEEDEGYSADPNDDFPSDEYYEEYAQENGIEIVPEPEPVIGAKYTKFKSEDDTSTQDKPKVNMMKNANNNGESTETPKNSATPTPAVKAENTTGKRRGRPSKLIGHEAEVVRLYTEGVSTKTISEKFSCSVSSVINCLRSKNVEIRPKGRRKSS